MPPQPIPKGLPNGSTEGVRKEKRLEILLDGLEQVKQDEGRFLHTTQVLETLGHVFVLSTV
jgi:hypothetical protein